jgi:hypothetical protein
LAVSKTDVRVELLLMHHGSERISKPRSPVAALTASV